MAQKLRDDKIGILQHSAGNIQMLASLSNPAYLTIGGQQYKVTSTLVVALPAMSANTRYQVFAVQSGGVVSLVISQNENSVGPAGYTRWKLVGSLQSNGLSPVAFGSFISIDGVPRTGRIAFNLQNNSQGFGTFSTMDSYYEIDGGFINLNMSMTIGTRTAVQARIGLPDNLTSLITPSRKIVGSMAYDPSTTVTYHLIQESSSSGFLYPVFNSAGSGGLSPIADATTIFGNGAFISGQGRVPITGYSNTPIKDR